MLLKYEIGKLSQMIEKLDYFYEKKAIGLRITSNCNWSQNNEKSTKFSFNLEKSWASQNTVRKFIEQKKKETSRGNSQCVVLFFPSDLFEENLKLPNHRIFQYFIIIYASRIVQELFSEFYNLLSENVSLQALNKIPTTRAYQKRELSSSQM